MRIGINWTSPATLSIVRDLIHQGIADFCEVMVDNVVHLTPDAIRSALPDVPLSLHIVSSRFLELPPTELTALADHLRPWIRALQPIYVSDHLLQFTAQTGVRLPMIAELDYDKHYAHIKNRVCEWQTQLDAPIFFENHASLTALGAKQADFFRRLMQEAEVGLLFDFSNAHIAELNHVCPFSTWDTLIQQTNHFHVAGFKTDVTSQLALDTHDTPLTEEILTILAKYHINQAERTLVVEFDANADFETWKQDIAKIRALA